MFILWLQCSHVCFRRLVLGAEMKIMMTQRKEMKLRRLWRRENTPWCVRCSPGFLPFHCAGPKPKKTALILAGLLETGTPWYMLLSANSVLSNTHRRVPGWQTRGESQLHYYTSRNSSTGKPVGFILPAGWKDQYPQLKVCLVKLNLFVTQFWRWPPGKT